MTMSANPSIPDTTAESIANEIMNRNKDKAHSGNYLRSMLIEAAREGFDEGYIEGRY